MKKSISAAIEYLSTITKDLTIKDVFDDISLIIFILIIYSMI